MLTSVVMACLVARAEEPETTEPADDRAPELIIVTGVRADTTTPVTKTELSREDLDALHHGQEVAYVLQNTPGVMAWGDTGLGVGYSYLSLRGIQQTRLDFTLNGVPLADMEDMGVFTSNLVDLTSSIESVQVQRGVGTAAGGTPSFAGAIHFESIGLDEQPGGELNVGFGSFGTARASVAAQTGAMGKWRAAFRVSGARTDGFRDSSDVAQASTFLSVARFGDRSTLRFTGLAGREHQHLSFYATDDYVLADAPTANPLGPDARDEFGQDIAQVQYSHDVGEDDEVSGSVYWNGGRGWYAVNQTFWDPASPLQKYTLNGGLVGAFGSYVARTQHWTVTPGFHVDAFRRLHVRTTDGVQDYTNTGTKTELSAFVKAAGAYGRWHPYADVQVRRAALSYVGSQDFDARSWGFVNPKLGVRYATDALGTYASVGMSGREPTRSDLFGGDDYDAAVFTDVVPERVLDAELGVDGRSERLTWAVNAYAMELFNEIALTGELLPTGVYRRRNVDRSWRRGLEADVTVRPIDQLTFQATGSLAWNGLAEWTQAYDVIDSYYYWQGSGSKSYEDVPVLLAPWGMGQLRATVEPVEQLSGSVGVRGVSRQFLDNTGDPNFVCPAFALVDVELAWHIDRAFARTTLALRMDNATNTTAYPSGYAWRFINDGASTQEIGGIASYYPNAPRSVFVNVTSKF